MRAPPGPAAAAQGLSLHGPPERGNDHGEGADRAGPPSRVQSLDLLGHRCSAGVPLGRGALEEQRLVEVPRHALAFPITHAEIVERVPPALRRGEPPPPHGFVVRLRHARAVVERRAEMDLGPRIALLGCETVPVRGGLEVNLDADPILITTFQ
jgi:hypothetical protein